MPWRRQSRSETARANGHYRASGGRCEASARDAMMGDFKTVMVSDANAARSDAEHVAALATLVQFFADVRSTDEVIGLLHATP